MNKLFIPSHKFRSAFREVLLETSYRKNARILNAGSTQKVLWFLLDGLVREIRVDSESFEEQTVWFWFNNSFLYTTPGFFSREPSQSTIEILEDCKVVLISYSNLARLKESFGETEIFTEKIRALHDGTRQLMIDDIRNLTTNERYLKHEKTLDNLFGRTQLRYIAGLVSMSPDTLGKLRRKYGRRGNT